MLLWWEDTNPLLSKGTDLVALGHTAGRYTLLGVRLRDVPSVSHRPQDPLSSSSETAAAPALILLGWNWEEMKRLSSHVFAKAEVNEDD